MYFFSILAKFEGLRSIIVDSFFSFSPPKSYTFGMSYVFLFRFFQAIYSSYRLNWQTKAGKRENESKKSNPYATLNEYKKKKT